ncbi:MAG: radical SAM family heme chaperone HemW [Bacteroidales bacterium]|nr:radical SAM family heme chaperone HemW [Bacteroidales bacterium]
MHLLCKQPAFCKRCLHCGCLYRGVFAGLCRFAVEVGRCHGFFKNRYLAGIYIHIPFCSQFCVYCDFYSTSMLGKRDAYADAVIKEIEFRSLDIKKSGKERNLVKTIYFGGGTPSVMSSVQLKQILDAVKANFTLVQSNGAGMQGFPEITIEVNPDDVTRDYAMKLKNAGFNRVSLGVQSFVDDHLRWMNRRHDSEKAKNAYRLLRDAGFCNISIDLIFGFEGLSMDQWRGNISTATDLAPEHISCYQLGIEKNTRLYKDYLSGSYEPLPDSGSYEQYSMLQQMLFAKGYIQYEVSSFCLPGKESRHNSSYWDFTPYYGLGPAAHSFDGNVREWNNKGINKYITGWKQGIRYFNKEQLTLENRFNEFVMLSLRTVKGMDLALVDGYLKGFPGGFIDKLERLAYTGDLVKEGGFARIPSHKLFVSDAIIRELFV